MSKLYPSQFIETVGVIVERFAETAFRAELPNGKVTVAFLELKMAHLKEVLKPGDRVRLNICPADFDRARIDGLLPDGGDGAAR